MGLSGAENGENGANSMRDVVAVFVHRGDTKFGRELLPMAKPSGMSNMR